MDASNSNLLDWIEKGQNKLKKITKNKIEHFDCLIWMKLKQENLYVSVY